MSTALTFPAFFPAAAHCLAQYKDCVATVTWPRLIFATRGGNTRVDFSINPPSVILQGSKGQANMWRGERRSTERRPGWQKETPFPSQSPSSSSNSNTSNSSTSSQISSSCSSSRSDSSSIRSSSSNAANSYSSCKSISKASSNCNSSSFESTL